MSLQRFGKALGGFAAGFRGDYPEYKQQMTEAQAYGETAQKQQDVSAALEIKDLLKRGDVNAAKSVLQDKMQQYSQSGYDPTRIGKLSSKLNTITPADIPTVISELDDLEMRAVRQGLIEPQAQGEKPEIMDPDNLVPLDGGGWGAIVNGETVPVEGIDPSYGAQESAGLGNVFDPSKLVEGPDGSVGVYRETDSGVRFFPVDGARLPPDPDLINNTQKYQDRFNKMREPMVDLAANYRKIRSSSRQESGVGDLGLVIAYMKMLDPGSVVREGEVTTVQQTGGIPDQVMNLYNAAKSGEKLQPNQRDAIVGAARGIYNAQRASTDLETWRIIQQAEQSNVPPKRILGKEAYEDFSRRWARPEYEVVDPTTGNTQKFSMKQLVEKARERNMPLDQMLTLAGIL